MKKHWKYFKYLMRHKWYVYKECRRLGLSPWVGIVHDLSKFSAVEWVGYAEFYCGDWKDGEEYNGQSRAPQAIHDAYDLAWNHHMKANPHHWQYWIMYFGPGTEKVLPIPDRYRREMVADWRGAGQAMNAGKDDTPTWYKRNRHKIVLHPITRTWVDEQMNY